MNYNPELAYAHPVVVLEEVGALVLIVPVTTSSDMVTAAYHPVDNPNGNKLLWRVYSTDGFSKTGAVILSNMRTISKGRLLDKKGGLHGISNPRSLFVEIKTKCFEICFPKQYITQLKLEKLVEDLTDDKKRLEKQIEDLQKELVELRAK
ncbi:hypothetical protein MCW62_12775 [Brevibacillus agri]|nr:hypothetical protein [Brevibacillus agri]